MEKQAGVRIVKKNQARVFMEGEELCREYIQTRKITFGMSELLPGQRGDIDRGHPESHEVFFVLQGQVQLFVEEDDKYYELHEGDAILMPEGMSHTLINTGETKAVLTWSQAPTHYA